MKINTVKLISFSPTGTTQHIMGEVESSLKKLVTPCGKKKVCIDVETDIILTAPNIFYMHFL